MKEYMSNWSEQNSNKNINKKYVYFEKYLIHFVIIIEDIFYLKNIANSFLKDILGYK